MPDEVSSTDFNNLVRTLQRLNTTLAQQPKQQDSAADLSQIGQSFSSNNISVMETPLISMSIDMKSLYRGMSRYFGEEGLKVEGKVVAMDPLADRKTFLERLLTKGPLTVNVENWEEIATGRSKEMRRGFLAGIGGILGKFHLLSNTNLVRALTIQGKAQDIRRGFFKGILTRMILSSDKRQEKREKELKTSRDMQIESLMHMDSSLVPLIYINSNLEIMKDLMITQFNYTKEMDEDRRQAALVMKDKNDELLNLMAPKPEEKEKAGFWKKVLGLGALGIGAVILNSIFGESSLKGISKLILKFGKSRQILAKAITGGFKTLFPRLAMVFSNIFGGLNKLIGKFLPKAAGKTLGKTVGKAATRGILKVGGKGLLKLVKKIPIVGLLLSAGFSAMRFKQGDILGGILEIGSGIASIFPGIGTGISLGIDLFLAARDIHDVKAKKTGDPTLGKKITNIFGKWVKPWLRHVPVYGTLISVGEGIMKFKKGDIAGGVIDMASGMVKLLPGLGLPMGLAIDFFSAKRVKHDTKARATGGQTTFNAIRSKLLDIPVIKWFTDIGSSIVKIAKGNFKDGFSDLAETLGIFDIVGWFEGLKKITVGGTGDFIATDSSNMITRIWDYLKETISILWTKIKDIVIGNVFGGLDLIKSGISFFKGKGKVDTVDKPSSDISKLGKEAKDKASSELEKVNENLSKLQDGVETLNLLSATGVGLQRQGIDVASTKQNAPYQFSNGKFGKDN
jgi:hypothetical protein